MTTRQLNRHQNSTWIFIFLGYLVILLFSANAHESLFYRPRSVHQWRQADSASQSLNFHQNEVSFWTPQLHNQAGQNGYAIAEFPVTYYFISILYDWFGVHEVLHRGTHLLIVMAGWWFLFLIGKRLTGSGGLALFPVALMSTFPVFFYYSNNFLPNAPAIGLVLIGWHAFFRYRDNPKLVWLYLMALFMLIACLLKVSEGISFIAILAVSLLSLLPGRLFPNAFIPRNHLLHWVGIAVAVIALNVAWYEYARYYNDVYGNNQSLIGILPFWEMNKDDWQLLEYMVEDVWLPHLMHPAWLYTLGVMTLLFLGLFLRMHELLRWITLLLLVGCGGYGLLFLKAFPMHDYYWLTFAIYPPFLLITLLEWGVRAFQGRHWLIKAVPVAGLFVLSTLGLMQNREIQKVRYTDDRFRSGLPEGSYELEPYLRSIGISRHAKVVSVRDKSPNITLYLMNNPGYSEAFNGGDYTVAGFQKAGAEFLIINDSSYLEKPMYQPFLKKQIGAYKGILIYDIRE
jgi:hypothetical protein